MNGLPSGNPAVSIVGGGGESIGTLEEWLEYAGPERGLAQWRDGYSAKEQAKAWLSSGSPAAPEEWWDAVSELVGDADTLIAQPEHETRFDRFARARQHDLLAEVRRCDETVAVVGVEAKACEPFDGQVADRGIAAPPSKQRPRCNLMAQALFGRPVFNEDDGTVLDKELAGHGYQLWTAAVGSIVEAQSRGLSQAILVLHQLQPADVAGGYADDDARDWPRALQENQAAVERFRGALEDAGGHTFETRFVAAGTRLTVVKVTTTMKPNRHVGRQ
jgi:hypothetical protein